MAKGFFVVYCTQALRQPKLYKLQSYAVKRCMQNPKFNFKHFPEEQQASIFFQNMQNQYLQTNRTNCLHILQNSLTNNHNIQKIATSTTAQNQKYTYKNTQDVKISRQDRQKWINQIFLKGKLFKHPAFKSTPVDLQTKDDFLGYFDGCSKGNPGISGIGYHIDTANNYKTVIQRCEFIGSFRTNNQSELIALNMLLADAYCNNINNLKVFGDSQLVIRYMTGAYKVHNPYLATVVQSAFSIARNIPNISFQHIVRAFNAKADKLSNKAILNKKQVKKEGVETQAALNQLQIGRQ